MPVTDFSPQNKVASRSGGYDYPKFSLKQGEKARVAVAEFPEKVYVHTLEKIVIDEHGKPMTLLQARKDGTTYEAHKKQFMARVICTGDIATMDANNGDPEGCIVCAYEKKFPSRIRKVEPRFAMHILRYKVKPNSTVIAKPFGVDVQVWAFSGTVFNKIADLNEEWGDIRSFDLVLGPCTNEGFQQFDIQVGAGKAEWLADADRKAVVKETLAENRIPNLQVACGRVKEDNFLKMDLDEISDSWDIADGKTSIHSDGIGADEDLNTAFSSKASATLDDDEFNFDDITEEVAKPKASTKVKAQAVEEPAEEEASDESEDMSLDELDALLN